MAFISAASDEQASSEVSELLEEHRVALGYVPNYARLFAHRPAFYAAWQQLRDAVAAELDPRRHELATLAAARELCSSYSALAHGKVLADRFLDADVVRALALDHRSAGLDDLDVAIMDLAAKVAADTTAIAEADVELCERMGSRTRRSST